MGTVLPFWYRWLNIEGLTHRLLVFKILTFNKISQYMIIRIISLNIIIVKQNQREGGGTCIAFPNLIR